MAFGGLYHHLICFSSVSPGTCQSVPLVLVESFVTIAYDYPCMPFACPYLAPNLSFATLAAPAPWRPSVLLPNTKTTLSSGVTLPL
jgi:hypothetical protein